MPLYEYQCAKDGTFELMQKFSDPPLTACPSCGGPVEKLLSAPAIQFKGSGWYITDYARKGKGGESKDKPAQAAESKGSGESKASGSTGGSTDSSASSSSSTSSTDKKTGSSDKK